MDPLKVRVSAIIVISPTSLRYFIWNQVLMRQRREVCRAGFISKLFVLGIVFPSHSVFRLGPTALENHILKTELSKAMEQPGSVIT